MRKWKIMVLFLAVFFGIPEISAKEVRMWVLNRGNVQRHEVVEVSLDTLRWKLGLSPSETFIVKNLFGQQQPYQITYDGKLLVEVSIRPHSKTELLAMEGHPAPMQTYVYGNRYPIRKDDIAWENDKGAYRVYGPALQKTGEKSYGTDIWVKNTPDLVVERRYFLDDEGNRVGDSLLAMGLKAEADSVDLATSFHYNHGNGMDVYAVGPTLGCGAPAFLKNGALVYPYCYHSYKILDNGPLRFTVVLDYLPNADGIVEHRLIRLDKGSHFNKITVWYDQMKTPVSWVSGVVLHTKKAELHDGENFSLGRNDVSYADPTQDPVECGSSIYVAVLFPNGVDSTYVSADGKHVLGVLRHYQGEKYEYAFGSAWSDYDVQTFREWQLVVQEALFAIRSPLHVVFQ